MGNNIIRSLSLPSAAVARVAGSSAGAAGFADGAGLTAALFSSPRSVLLNGTVIYVADRLNWRIRTLSVATGVVATLAGGAGSGGADGACLGPARLFGPLGLAWGGGGTLFFSDRNAASQVGTVIRRLDLAPSGACTVTTLAGQPTAATAAVNGFGTNAQFSNSAPALAFAGDSTLLIGDSSNNLLRALHILALAERVDLLRGHGGPAGGGGAGGGGGGGGAPEPAWRRAAVPSGGAGARHARSGGARTLGRHARDAA
jgi:hypothetical protein